MNRQIIIQFSDEEVEWVARNLYQLPHRVNDTHKKRAADAMAYWFVQAIKDGCIMGKMTWVINKKNNLRPVLRMASFHELHNYSSDEWIIFEGKMFEVSR